MTCVVGLKHGSKIYMAADSIASNEVVKASNTFKKIFRKDGMLIGHSGYIRAYQLLRYRMTIPERPTGMEPIEYMATLFIDKMRNTFKEFDYGTVENNEEHSNNSFLIGYADHLYEVSSWNYEVFEWSHPFGAIGSGERYALGALGVPSRKSPRQRVREAIEVAALFSPYVGGDIQIEVL